MLNEAQSVYYFATKLFADGPATLDRATLSVVQQVIIGGFIVKLLCFSLCLVFWQRKTAVARARAEEQLVQERLEARLTQQRLEQEKAQVQLRALQAQVNPHFLFNSLNSLSALIDEEPERAGQFVDQLSVVYRYLLRTSQAANSPEPDGDHALTTLDNELAFIESYYHLLQTRYGTGLQLHVSAGAPYQSQLLPPLTLQLLVENAVKHNVTSSTCPLRVDIFIDSAGYLTVRNNLQRKRSRIASNGVGLATITTQYINLHQPAPQISEENGQFTVRLPLIAPGPSLPFSA
jgi:LytS/YehU family sensor histidine kinase